MVFFWQKRFGSRTVAAIPTTRTMTAAIAYFVITQHPPQTFNHDGGALGRSSRMAHRRLRAPLKKADIAAVNRCATRRSIPPLLFQRDHVNFHQHILRQARDFDRGARRRRGAEISCRRLRSWRRSRSCFSGTRSSARLFPSPIPAAFRISDRLRSTRSVCAATSPETICWVAGSMAICPDTNTNPLALMACE